MTSLLPQTWWQYAGKSAEEVLTELFADAPQAEQENVFKLQAYLCGLWIDSGCPPDRVSFFMIAAVGLGFPHEGGAYPEGGTGEMAAALVQSIETRGGACLVRAPVKRVLTEESSGRALGVEMVSDVGGAKLLAKRCVVSACGWRNTARLCKDCKAFPQEDELALNQGDSFVMANIGLKGSAAELRLECTNMELLPAGNGVSVFDGIRNYMQDPLGVPPMEIPMMLTFPSVKDRAYSRGKKKEGDQGRETAQILCLAKPEWFGGLPAWMPAWQHPHRGSEYKDLKKKWMDRLLFVLCTIYPQLEGKIEMADLSTPLTVEHYLSTGSGSAIGLDTSAGKGCRFTDTKVMKQLDMRSPVPDLWLTGQDALMCGVPLAQAAGLITAIRIVGPVRSAWFFLRTAWLLAASLGQKAREKR
jgi:all-trans-retinol 13,14-reductase